MLNMTDPLSLPNMNPNEQRRLPAVFYYEAVENKHKSALEGRPIFDEILYINIIRPGDKTTDIHRKATDKDKQNYARELDLFLRKGEQAISGTPIEQLTFLNRAQIAELKAMNVFSVEALSSLDDRSAFMGWRDLRNKANAFLAMAKDQAVMTQWKEREEALEVRGKNQDQKIDALEQQVRDLMDKLTAPDKPTPPKKAA